MQSTPETKDAEQTWKRKMQSAPGTKNAERTWKATCKAHLKQKSVRGPFGPVVPFSLLLFLLTCRGAGSKGWEPPPLMDGVCKAHLEQKIRENPACVYVGR